VLVIDRQPTFAYGLAALLRSQTGFGRPAVALTAGSARLELARRRFDVLALGLRVPGGAAQLCVEARTTTPGIRAAIFLEPGDGVALAACRRELPTRVLVRDAPVSEIVGTLRALVHGLHGSPAAADGSPDPWPLTERERGIIGLLAHGLTSSEVASVLELAPNTVRSYCQDILRKLGARNRAHALELARDHGLLTEAPQDVHYLQSQVS